MFLNSILRTTKKFDSNSTPKSTSKVCNIFKQVIQLTKTKEKKLEGCGLPLYFGGKDFS